MNSVILNFFSGLSDAFYIVIFAVVVLVVNIVVCYFNSERQIEINKKMMFFLSCFHFIIYSLVKNSYINVVVGLFSCYILFDYLVLLITSYIKRLLKKRNEKELSKKLTYHNHNVISPAERVVSILKAKPNVCEKENNDNKGNKNNDIINLSHVKNMIKRLDCCSLTSAEIEQIENLKMYISDYDSGIKDREVCSGINDGLNAMLKIMAKYSV